MDLPAPAAPIAVLDTNVVLDLLLFHNSECASLQLALNHAQVRWLATAELRGELAHVLARGSLDRWNPDLVELWAHWNRLCIEVPVPPAAGREGRFRCTDQDDQKFIDLAVACSARWLVSRDRAVLKLAGRLRERGIQVVTPGGWAMPSRTG